MKLANALLAGALALASLGAQATTITVDNAWHSFTFGDVGSSWDQTFDFTISGPTLLKITDAYLSGDQFAVFNFATLLGNTSIPTSIGVSNADYDYTFSNPTWSSASYLLAAGTYSISGTAIASPFGSGGAAIQLAAAVPEPETYAMTLAGLGLLGFAARRRKQA
jgi:hypothetical protein